MTSRPEHILLRSLSFLLVMTFLGSCARQKETVTISGPATPNFIKRNMEASLLDYEWFAAKISTDVNMNGEKTSFKTNFRMKKDSIIWMSISPALGIEVARIIVTKDSVKFVDKWNDRYYLGGHEFIKDRINMDLDFNLLQDLAIGNPLLYDPEEKFKGNKDDVGYILTSKSKAKVRRAAGLRLTRKNAESMEDTLIMDIDERRYDRVIERFDEEEERLMIKRYWIHAENFKVVRSIVNDLASLRSIEADYTEFEDVEERKVPVKMNYIVMDAAQTGTFELEFSRVKLDRPTTFPFSIPEKFVEIK